MTKAATRLAALEGTHGGALGAAARAMAADKRQQRPCVSTWDASGIFKEVLLASVGAGQPSVRTLLLLYAADLAFRWRAEIQPALEAGRLVIVTPHVDTAIAFGQAAGLDERWLTQMLSFAPVAGARELIDGPPAVEPGDRKGFVEFCCSQLTGQDNTKRLELLKRTATLLKARLKGR